MGTRKFSTLFAIILELVVFDVINGEVDFCLEFKSNYVSENQGSIKEVPALLQQVENEIENVLSEFILGADTANYTYFHLNISHPAITFQGDFTDGTTVTDDSTIKLWTLTNEGLEIFNLTFPYITVNGSYIGEGYVGANRLFDIYGNGTFDFALTNFSIAAVTSLKINSSALCIPLSINVYLKDYHSDFKNFMNGDVDLEPLLNGAIIAIVPEAVRIIFRESMDGADPYFQDIIDGFLHGSESLSKLLFILANNVDQLTSILKSE